jgi:hypothetical protein
VPFILELTHQLSDYLSVCLTSECDITQVFVLDFRVVIDYSIVDDVNFFVLVVMRMAVSFAHLTASGPSGMGDSHCRADGFFGEFIDESFNAIQT